MKVKKKVFRCNEDYFNFYDKSKDRINIISLKISVDKIVVEYEELINDKEMGKIKDLVQISFNVDSSIKCQKPQIIDRTKECISLWEQRAEEQKQKNKVRLAQLDPFAFIKDLEECPW